MEEAVKKMKDLEKTLDHKVSGCPGDVIGLFADGSTFGPETDCDAKSGDFIKGPFTYPLQLQVELGRLAPPERLTGQTSYTIKVEYLAVHLEQKGKESQEVEELLGTQVLKIDQAMFSNKAAADPDRTKTKDNALFLTLHVPAQADRMRLSADEKRLLIAAPEIPTKDDGAALLAQLVKTKWRGTRIRHLSDWTPSGVRLFFDKAKELKLLPGGEDPKAYYGLSWWQPEALGTARELVAKALAKAKGSLVDPLLRTEEVRTVKAVGD
jgi:hypothetical protein